MAAAAPPSTRLRPDMVSVAGMETGVLRLGNPRLPKLLLLHGFSGDLTTWQYNIGILARRFQVTAVDLPGHGLARGDEMIGDWRLMPDWLAAFLDAMDLAPCHVAGHSLGGRIALALAERGDARLRSLTLVACAGITPSYDYAFLERLSHIDSLEDALACSRRLVGGARIDLRPFARSLHAKLSAPAAQRRLARFLQSNFADGRLLSPVPVDWSRVQVPLQFIWGADDTVIAAPPPGSLPAHAPCHVIDEVGHLPHLLAPDRINRLVAEFALA